MSKDDIAALISRRRRQILVHSVIYYRFNDNLISDDTWSKWAEELEDLQNKYPDLADEAALSEEFRDFDHSTGMNLPLDNKWAIKKAKQLLKMKGIKI